MSATRRDLLVAGAAAPLILAFPAVAAPPLWQIVEHPAPAAARTHALAAGAFVDDAFVARLPAGDYLATLSPANALLLHAVLRSRRVAVHGSATLRFTLDG